MSVLTEEQVAGHMDAASSDIKFLLDKEDVEQADAGAVVRGRCADSQAVRGAVQGCG